MGGLSSVQSVRRSKIGRNSSKMFVSQQSPLNSNYLLTKSGSRSRSRFDDVKPKVYDHLSPSTSKTKIISKTKKPTFTPRVLERSKKLCKFVHFYHP